MTEAAYTNAYLRAFVVGPTTYRANRRNRRGASHDVFYWFVTLNGYYTVEEYEGKYGELA